MIEKNRQGFHIYKDIVEKTGLSGNELLVYCLINTYSNEYPNKYYGTTNTIAQYFNISVKSVKNILERLLEKRLIFKYVNKYNNVKYAIYEDKKDDFLVKGEDFSTNGEEISDGIDSSLNGIDSSLNGIDSILPLKENKENTKEKHIFVIPTVKEVKDYCLEKNYQIDIENFFDYYNKHEWKWYDKNLKKYRDVKDWKMCVRTFVKNKKKFELNTLSKEAYIKDVEMRQKKQTKDKDNLDALANLDKVDLSKFLEDDNDIHGNQKLIGTN